MKNSCDACSLGNPAAAAFVRAGARPEPDVAPSLVAALLRERYPTNVRELEQHLLRALRVSRSPPLRLDDGAGVVRVEDD